MSERTIDDIKKTQYCQIPLSQAAAYDGQVYTVNYTVRIWYLVRIVASPSYEGFEYFWREAGSEAGNRQNSRSGKNEGRELPRCGTWGESENQAAVFNPVAETLRKKCNFSNKYFDGYCVILL